MGGADGWGDGRGSSEAGRVGEAEAQEAARAFPYAAALSLQEAGSGLRPSSHRLVTSCICPSPSPWGGTSAGWASPLGLRAGAW